MAEVQVRNVAGEVVGTLPLADSVWGIEPNHAVLHQAVVRQLADRRQGTHDTKTRGEVSGGGWKPWRQKGTGRARQGSIRAPHWKGGGVVFGPHPRDYHQDMPQKMRRLALKSALASKARDGELIVVDELTIEQPKTKLMVELLKRLGITDSVLIGLAADDPQAEWIGRAARNIPRVEVKRVEALDVYSILKHKYLLLGRRAVQQLEGALA
jgi:large subunit ribosomal protein L4